MADSEEEEEETVAVADSEEEEDGGGLGLGGGGDGSVFTPNMYAEPELYALSSSKYAPTTMVPSLIATDLPK